MVTKDIIALRTRFVSAWNHAFPVAYDGQPEVDQPATGWVRFSVRPGGSMHYSGDYQNGSMLQLGRVWLQVFVQDGSGDADALSALEAFATIFRHWQSDDFALTCKTEDMNAPMPDKETGMTIYTMSVQWESVRRYR